MYPNDNRFPENMPNIEGMNSSMYGNHMRTPSMDMSGRPPYYDPSYQYKAPIIQPVYDYMNQSPMMPMNQAIDPRYSNWRQSSENRGLISYYDRPMAEPFMHSKQTVTAMGYQENYPSHEHLRAPQMNILQRISYLIKPQLPELKRIMSRISAISSTKKKEPSRRQRSRQRQRQRDRSRSYERNKKSSSSSQWVCANCSFLNFDWRDKCKKCNETKPAFPSNKNFTPGPEDWKCVKCGNLNYARRMQCNRCKFLKNNNGNNR